MCYKNVKQTFEYVLSTHKKETKNVLKKIIYKESCTWYPQNIWVCLNDFLTQIHTNVALTAWTSVLKWIKSL